MSGGQFLGFQFAQDLAGEGVDLGALAFEPDRLGAATKGGQLPYQAEQVPVPGTCPRVVDTSEPGPGRGRVGGIFYGDEGLLA
ncbi:hypothetical protein ACWGSU_31895, partial [Streptomyces koyangensis]